MTDTALQPFAETDATVEPAEAEVSPTPPAPMAAEPVTPATASGRVVTASAPMVSDSSSFVYAIGRIEPRFPSLSVEKEFAQATRPGRHRRPDRPPGAARRPHRPREPLPGAQAVLGASPSRAWRPTCCVPRDPADFDLLVEAVRADAGRRRPRRRHRRARPARPAGDVQRAGRADRRLRPDLLLRPRRAASRRSRGRRRPKAARVRPGAEELFGRILQTGRQRRRHRRAPGPELPGGALPARSTPAAAEQFARNCVLHRGRRASLAAAAAPATIVDVIFTFTNRASGRHREVLRPRRRHRGVPVPGHQAGAVLREVRTSRWPTTKTAPTTGPVPRRAGSGCPASSATSQSGSVTPSSAPPQRWESNPAAAAPSALPR